MAFERKVLLAFCRASNDGSFRISRSYEKSGAKGLTSKQLEREIGMRPIKEYTEVLEYLGVIERSMRGSTFVLQGRCALWNDWYRERIAS